jgi:hypothetical protein
VPPTYDCEHLNPILKLKQTAIMKVPCLRPEIEMKSDPQTWKLGRIVRSRQMQDLGTFARAVNLHTKTLLLRFQ